MDKYMLLIKKRLRIYYVFDALAVIVIVVNALYGDSFFENSSNMKSMIHGALSGIFLGFQIVLLSLIVKHRRALKNEASLKKMYIEENDERAKLIKDKIGGAGLDFAIGTIATATIVSGFYNQTVFITLLCVLLFISLTKGTLKFYYRNKY